MQAIGLNRLFGSIITSPGLDYRMLPTISFCISILIAFATGTVRFHCIKETFEIIAHFYSHRSLGVQ